MLKQQEAMSNGSVAFLSYRSSCTVGFGMSLGIQFICDLITNMVTQFGIGSCFRQLMAEYMRFPFL